MAQRNENPDENMKGASKTEPEKAIQQLKQAEKCEEAYNQLWKREALCLYVPGSNYDEDPGGKRVSHGDS
ncbi:hypothetical protein CDV36_011471 [Fusarium kuroshium]|uniref:Uncharacterized protein n=1 Tax=Fusarium kuroshium TaxID=2010991 RepID=A0A3M2RUF7_9HYPO|nr:hypothetical protein CDV36_011471 [Fusarium kuroshium]